MKPLYCFKYEEDTGKITKIVIPEYGTSTNRFTGRKTYYFNKPKINKSDSLYQVPEAKLDRYVSNKVYTFNGNIQRVKSIIFAELESRQLKSYAEYQKYAFQVERFLETNPEYNNQEYGA